MFGQSIRKAFCKADLPIEEDLQNVIRDPPREPGGTRGLATALALVLAASPVMAQTTPAQRPAAPAPTAPRPAAPAPAAPMAPGAPAAPGAAGAAGQQAQSTGPMVVQVKAEPSQPEWTKVCGKDQGTNAEICYTTRDFVSDQGQPVLAVALYDVKGGPQPQKIVRFLMPLGLLLQPGIRFTVDQGQPTPGRYAICFPNGCFAESAGEGRLHRGSQEGREPERQCPEPGRPGGHVRGSVAGFAKAFDGPAIDPKVLEDQQKKLQDELEKRSEELRKQLGSGASAPGAAAPAAPAAPAAAPKP